jgi:hypothetical protein
MSDFGGACKLHTREVCPESFVEDRGLFEFEGGRAAKGLETEKCFRTQYLHKREDLLFRCKIYGHM